jgi:hypothetical protein
MNLVFTSRYHVYDGERCVFCNTNIYDEAIYGDTECVEHEPVKYTTETPVDSKEGAVVDGTIWMNPDCTTGKHPACRGDAWDLHSDSPTSCECDCHPTSGQASDE